MLRSEFIPRYLWDLVFASGSLDAQRASRGDYATIAASTIYNGIVSVYPEVIIYLINVFRLKIVV